MRSALCCLLLFLTGCVERWIFITSDPPGAAVEIDGEAAGTTPTQIPFTWYGTRRATVTMPGHETRSDLIEINAPWWQFFPLDLIADLLLPFTLTDSHDFHLTLTPAAQSTHTLEEMRRRAEAARRAASGEE